jgi:hypothetical protein
MKHLLFSIGVVTLLSTSGCIFPGRQGGGDYREQGEYRAHEEYQESPEYRQFAEPSEEVRNHGE